MPPFVNIRDPVPVRRLLDVARLRLRWDGISFCHSSVMSQPLATWEVAGQRCRFGPEETRTMSRDRRQTGFFATAKPVSAPPPAVEGKVFELQGASCATSQLQPCVRRRLMSLWMDGGQGTEKRLVDDMARGNVSASCG